MAVTTRFPGDAADRFRAVPESARWLDRLEIVGIDVRDPRRVLDLCDRLLTAGEPLDILVNHAAQTVRRSAASYAALAGRELAAGPHDDGQVGTTALLPQVDESGLLPDLSPVNSWSARLGELDATETVETQLVNAIAPALLCSALRSPAPAPARLETPPPLHRQRQRARGRIRGARQDEPPSAHQHGQGRSQHAHPHQRGRPGRSGRVHVRGRHRLGHEREPRTEAGAPVWGVLLKNYREAAW